MSSKQCHQEQQGEVQRAQQYNTTTGLNYVVVSCTCFGNTMSCTLRRLTLMQLPDSTALLHTWQLSAAATLFLVGTPLALSSASLSPSSFCSVRVHSKQPECDSSSVHQRWALARMHRHYSASERCSTASAKVASYQLDTNPYSLALTTADTTPAFFAYDAVSYVRQP
eukprot:17935-Heterococcus_DN1.PRE.3